MLEEAGERGQEGDVALWCYEWIGRMDGSPGGVKYRGPSLLIKDEATKVGVGGSSKIQRL